MGWRRRGFVDEVMGENVKRLNKVHRMHYNKHMRRPLGGTQEI